MVSEDFRRYSIWSCKTQIFHLLRAENKVTFALITRKWDDDITHVINPSFSKEAQLHMYIQAKFLSSGP